MRTGTYYATVTDNDDIPASWEWEHDQDTAIDSARDTAEDEGTFAEVFEIVVKRIAYSKTTVEMILE